MYEAIRLVLIFIGIACILAGLIVSVTEWSWREWAKQHGKESWLLDTLLVTNIVQDVVGLWLVGLTLLRFAGVFLPEWTGLVTLAGLSVMFAKKVWRHHMIVKHADGELMRSRNEEPQ